jgi:DNA end-binding protein Ku
MPARALSPPPSRSGSFRSGQALLGARTEERVSFNQIDKKDGSRVKQQLVNSRSGEVVAREELVKGYEFAKGQYVLFEPNELKTLEAAATHTIDIVEFLKADQIDRQYLDKVYYLGTDKGGARPTSCSRRRSTRRVVASASTRTRQAILVMVRPMGDKGS